MWNSRGSNKCSLSFVPSTVFERRVLRRPPIQKITTTFVFGVPEGVANITLIDGGAETVFLNHVTVPAVNTYQLR